MSEPNPEPTTTEQTVDSSKETVPPTEEIELEEKIEKTEQKLEDAKDDKYASKDDIGRLEKMLTDFRTELTSKKDSEPKVPAPEKKKESEPQKVKEDSPKEPEKEPQTDKPYGSSRWFARKQK